MLVQYGETVVLVAAASSDPRPGLDFFPLMCDYRERLAAADKPAGVSQAALANEDAVCAEALELFVEVYGAEAGNLALRCLALGCG